MLVLAAFTVVVLYGKVVFTSLFVWCYSNKIQLLINFFLLKKKKKKKRASHQDFNFVNI